MRRGLNRFLIGLLMLNLSVPQGAFSAPWVAAHGSGSASSGTHHFQHQALIISPKFIARIPFVDRLFAGRVFRWIGRRIGGGSESLPPITQWWLPTPPPAGGGPMTANDVSRAVAYHRGELKTSPVKFDFRPSMKGDVQMLRDVPPDLRRRAIEVALDSIHRGKIIVGIPAAGASSRMNPRTPPPDVEALVEEMYGHPKVLVTKAAVPIGKYNGVIQTYLGAFMQSWARMEAAVEQWAGSIKHNQVYLLTNDEAEAELFAELELRQRYGVRGEILAPHQAMGFKFVATPADTQKAKGRFLKDKNEAAYERALARSKSVMEAIEAGRGEAAVIQDEKAVLGHGEVDHQAITSGLLAKMFRENIEAFTLRNNENIAGDFSEDWLVSLGLFLIDEVDFQLEVCPRAPGQVGGALITRDNNNTVIAENPSFGATWNTFVEDMKAEGYTIVSPDEVAMLAAQEMETKGRILLTPYRMNNKGGTIESLAEAMELLKPYTESDPNPRLFLLRKGQAIQWIRRVVPEDTYWFNDAVGIKRPAYWWHIYGNPKQSLRDFKEEVNSATPEQLQAIADRGKGKHPVLIDPKPAKGPDVVAAAAETNVWQGSLIADTAKIRAVGVDSVKRIDVDTYRTMTPTQRQEAIAHLRMLGAKQWKGEESYEFNQLFYPDLLERIFTRPLFPADIPPPGRSRARDLAVRVGLLAAVAVLYGLMGDFTLHGGGQAALYPQDLQHHLGPQELSFAVFSGAGFLGITGVPVRIVRFLNRWLAKTSHRFVDIITTAA